MSPGGSGPSPSPERVPPLAGALPLPCQRDLATLRGFVRESVAGAPPAEPAGVGDFRHVLLTGATGFVGRFLLRELLGRDPRLTVHCIVRGATAEEGFERVRAGMEHAETWDETFAPRLRVHPGDVSEPRLGLGEPRFDELCGTIDAVYHLAAKLSLTSGYPAIRRDNVSAVRNVLELCLARRFKHLFFVSTMGIFPEYFCAFADEYRDRWIDDQMQPDLSAMKKAMPLGLLGYPWSKLVGEQAVLFARSVGLPAVIFRLAQTSMASTGYSESSNIVQSLFAGIVDVEMIPRGFALQSMNDPVDILCRACAAISLNPKRRFTIYNCCNPTPSYRTVPLGELGLDYPEVSYQTFKRACQARGDASPLSRHWAVLDHFARYWLRGTETVTALPVSDRAMREDCPDPIEWPGPLTRYVRYSKWVTSHQEEWPHPLPRRGLDLDYLLRRARHYARDNGVSFDSTYPEWMLEGLEKLVEALGSEDAGLPRHRIGHVTFDMCRLLRNNAELAAERERHAEIGRQNVVRPVFIVGINRTGTTFLHRLMARADRFWSIRAFEYVEPVIPGGDYARLAGTPEDPRRALAADVFEASGIIDSFAGTHYIGIDEPEEDIPILRLSFRAWMFATRYRIPQYERWLEASGSREAYRHHRRVMQHYKLPAPSASSRRGGPVAVQDADASDGARSAERGVSGRPVHSDASRARTVHGVLVQPGGTDWGESQRTRPAGGHRSRTAAGDEPPSRPRGGFPRISPRDGRAVDRRELLRPGAGSHGGGGPHPRSARVGARARHDRRHERMAGRAGGAPQYREATQVRRRELRPHARHGGPGVRPLQGVRVERGNRTPLSRLQALPASPRMGTAGEGSPTRYSVLLGRLIFSTGKTTTRV